MAELGGDAPAGPVDLLRRLGQQGPVGLAVQHRLALVRPLGAVHTQVSGDDQSHLVPGQLRQGLRPRLGQLAVRLGQVLVGGRADGPVAQLHGAQPPRLPQKSFHGVCLLCSLLRALRGRLCAENCITARPHGQEILLTASGFSSILEET